MIRRTLASVLAVGAVLGTIAATRPPPPPVGRPVVVAAADLPTGSVLEADDLEVTTWPELLAPATAVGRPADLVGQVLNAPVSDGEAITAGRVSGAGLLVGQPSATAAAYLPLQSVGVASMVRPGDRVDVVAPGGTRLAQRVIVLRVLGGPTTVDPAAASLLGDGSGAEEPGLVLAVPADQVADVTRAVDPQTGVAPAVVLSPID